MQTKPVTYTHKGNDLYRDGRYIGDKPNAEQWAAALQQAAKTIDTTPTTTTHEQRTRP